MDWDGKVSAPQPVCAASGRQLLPGETVFSALVVHEGRFERRDIAAESWAGWDQSQALSWWRRTVPAPQKRPQKLRLDPQALVRIFADLADSTDPAQMRFRYIVALCLLRARKLVLDGIQREATGSVLVVHERGGASHRLPDPALQPADEGVLTEQLMAVAGEAGPSAGGGAHAGQVEHAE